MATPETVDIVLDDLLHTEDPVLQYVRAYCRDVGLPAIEVSVQQGKMLECYARALYPARILEIGTLGGYSTICLARGLAPNGVLTTMEYDRAHAEVADHNLKFAGLRGSVRLMSGSPALELLPTLESGFDLVFIDADKENNEAYFKWALDLTHRNGVIIVDNVIRDGRVIEPTRPEKLAFIKALGELQELSQVALSVVQTVGSKGWDGFVYAVKL